MCDQGISNVSGCAVYSARSVFTADCFSFPDACDAFLVILGNAPGSRGGCQCAMYEEAWAYSEGEEGRKLQNIDKSKVMLDP